MGDALDDGGGDGNFEVLHGPGQKVDPHFLADFVPELMLPEGTLEQGFEGYGQGGGVGLDLRAILREGEGYELRGEGFEEYGGLREGLAQALEVLRWEGVRAHHFHQVAAFALRGRGGGRKKIRHDGLLAV